MAASSVAQVLGLLLGGPGDTSIAAPDAPQRSGLDMSEIFQPAPDASAIGDLIEDSPTFAVDEVERP
ncbi:MAG: hypothetical protein AAF919_15615 [Pseudomonadota bacterium]